MCGEVVSKYSGTEHVNTMGKEEKDGGNERGADSAVIMQTDTAKN